MSAYYIINSSSGSRSKACSIIIGAVCAGIVVLALAIVMCCYLGHKLHQQRQKSHDTQRAAKAQIELARVKHKLGMYLVTHPYIVEMNDLDIFPEVQKDIPDLDQNDANHVLSLVAARRLRIAEIDKMDV